MGTEFLLHYGGATLVDAFDMEDVLAIQVPQLVPALVALEAEDAPTMDHRTGATDHNLAQGRFGDRPTFGAAHLSCSTNF